MAGGSPLSFSLLTHPKDDGRHLKTRHGTKRSTRHTFIDLRYTDLSVCPFTKKIFDIFLYLLNILNQPFECV